MNIEVGPPEPSSGYRKISIASWGKPRDPQVYSWVDLSVEKVEPFLAGIPGRPSLTHYTAKVIGDLIEETGIFRQALIRGRLRPRQSVGAFVTTLVRGKNGYDLSGFLIDDVPGKALAQIAEESKAKLSMLRKGGDPAMRRADKLSRITPQWILTLMLPFHAWLGYSLNLDPRPIGFPKDNFGAFMVSSIGALGLEHGLIPLSPYSRVPLIIGVGKPRLRPNVRDGQVVAEKMVRLTFTFDHRLADGVHGAILMKRLTDAFEKPESFHA